MPLSKRVRSSLPHILLMCFIGHLHFHSHSGEASSSYISVPLYEIYPYHVQFIDVLIGSPVQRTRALFDTASPIFGLKSSAPGLKDCRDTKKDAPFFTSYSKSMEYVECGSASCCAVVDPKSGKCFQICSSLEKWIEAKDLSNLHLTSTDSSLLSHRYSAPVNSSKSSRKPGTFKIAQSTKKTYTFTDEMNETKSFSSYMMLPKYTSLFRDEGTTALERKVKTWLRNTEESPRLTSAEDMSICGTTISYGDGSSMLGPFFRDSIAVGATMDKNLMIEYPRILSVFNGDNMFREDFNGILGASPSDETSSLETALAAFLSTVEGGSNAFGICASANGGELTLGGYNSNYTVTIGGEENNFTYIQMWTLDGFYETTVVSFEVDLKYISIGDTSLNFIWDSGTTALLFPRVLFLGLYNELSNFCNSAKNSGLTCLVIKDGDLNVRLWQGEIMRLMTYLPTLKVGLLNQDGNEVKFQIPPKNYLEYVDKVDGFIELIVEVPAPPYIIGSAATRNSYIYYDSGNSRLGFIQEVSCPKTSERDRENLFCIPQTFVSHSSIVASVGWTVIAVLSGVFLIFSCYLLITGALKRFRERKPSSTSALTVTRRGRGRNGDFDMSLVQRSYFSRFVEHRDIAAEPQ